MKTRPELSRDLDSGTFREYYYLKEELVAFCRENRLPVTGGKQDLTERIARFLDTGEAEKAPAGKPGRKRRPVSAVTGDSVIEDGFVCTEAHRAFFRKEIGPSFSFSVQFQQWLKTHAGATCREAVSACRGIQREKKQGKTSIGKQFEYNAYIRAFFEDNAGRTLEEAVKCWKYKKSLLGHNRYEPSDLCALET